MTPTTLSNLMMPTSPSVPANSAGRQGEIRQPAETGSAANEPRRQPAEQPACRDRHQDPRPSQDANAPQRDASREGPADDRNRADHSNPRTRRKLRELFNRLGLDPAAIHDHPMMPQGTETAPRALELRELMARQLGLPSADALAAAIGNRRAQTRTHETGQSHPATDKTLPVGQAAMAASKVGENTLAIDTTTRDGQTATATVKVGENALAAGKTQRDGQARKVAPKAGKNALAAGKTHRDGPAPIITPKTTESKSTASETQRTNPSAVVVPQAGDSGLAAGKQMRDGTAVPGLQPGLRHRPDAAKTQRPLNAPQPSATTQQVKNTPTQPHAAATNQPATPDKLLATNPAAQHATQQTADALAAKKARTANAQQRVAQTTSPSQTRTATVSDTANTQQTTGTRTPRSVNAAPTALQAANAIAARFADAAERGRSQQAPRTEKVRRQYGLPDVAAPKAETQADTARTAGAKVPTPQQAQTPAVDRYAPPTRQGVRPEPTPIQPKAPAPKAAPTSTSDSIPAAAPLPQAPTPLGATANVQARVASIDTQVVDQVTTAIRFQATPDMQQITVRLNPAELGRVTIDIRSDAEGIRGVVQVENTRTLADLQREAPQLIERLQEAGIRVKDLEFQMNDPGRDGQQAPGQKAQNAYAQFSQGQGQRGSTWNTQNETASTLGSIFDNNETTPEDGWSDDTQYVGTGALNVMI